MVEELPGVIPQVLHRDDVSLRADKTLLAGPLIAAISYTSGYLAAAGLAAVILIALVTTSVAGNPSATPTSTEPAGVRP